MPTEQLYDLAFQFRKTKLWNKLYDSQLFAVRHADGTVGYCCVMGAMGEHLALAVYPGDAGMRSYRLMGMDRTGLNDFEMRELTLSQDCVMCSFENKDDLRPRELEEVRNHCDKRQISPRGKNAYPQFQRFRPHYYPWYVDDAQDQAHLQEALEAALEVSAKLQNTDAEALGFTEGAPINRRIPILQKRGGGFEWDALALPQPLPVRHPSPVARDDIALGRLAKSKKRGGEWACDVLLHLDPVSDEANPGTPVEEPKNAPFFPYLLLIVDNDSGKVLGLHSASDPEDYSEAFVRAILDTAINTGKPRRILVCTERAHALFEKLAAQIGVKLAVEDRIPLLDEAEQSLMEHFSGEDGSDEDVFEQMIQALRDPKALATMPDELLVQLMQFAQTGALPAEIAQDVAKECKRRGL